MGVILALVVFGATSQWVVLVYVCVEIARRGPLRLLELQRMLMVLLEIVWPRIELLVIMSFGNKRLALMIQASLEAPGVLLHLEAWRIDVLLRLRLLFPQTRRSTCLFMLVRRARH